MSAIVDPEFIRLQRALAGEYSIERELGRGGMGIVYLAREVKLDRLVAIKLLPEHLSAREDLRERFLREARMAASLSHPHIVPIHRVGEVDGVVFFAMSYIQGETVGERLRTRGPLSPAATMRMLKEVSWALAYAHGRGIVHRDIKPDNIMLEDESGRALVMDFGIARHTADEGDTDPGRIMGTAQFISPEQATNESLDGRSDLYSLGVVGFLVSSGRLPYEAESVTALLVKRVSTPAPRLATVSPEIPARLANAIDRCLAIRAEDRFPSGEALAEALEAAPVAGRALPLPLRVWAERRDPLGTVYGAWTVVTGFGTTMGIIASHHVKWGSVALVIAPIVPYTLFHAHKAYRALAAGYTLADLRVALRTWQAERRDAIAFEVVEKPSWPLRAVRTAVAAAALSAVTLITTAIIMKPHFSNGSWLDYVTMILGGTLVGGMLLSNALGVPYIPPRWKRRSVGRGRSWFWNSRFGEIAAKLLTPRHRALASATYRPTEMALSLAIGELFDALPSPYRADIPELPSIVSKLETRAADCRAQLDEIASLAASGGPGGDAALAERRALVERELADTVAALEAIRLDLLRLHGGASDLQPITTMLESAARLGTELERLASAEREASLALKPAKPLTPA